PRPFTLAPLTDLYPPPLHDALPISDLGLSWQELDGIRQLPDYEQWYLPYSPRAGAVRNIYAPAGSQNRLLASVEVGGLLDSHDADRKSTRLNSSHVKISYAVFCLKK